MTFDLINACFEIGGALAGWRNVRQLQRDKSVRGVYWPMTAFFAAWGYWNLIYYPSLGQWLSAGAGLLLAIANTAWVLIALRYRNEAATAAPTSRAKCYGCGRPVIESDDDAHICIRCGGMNRRA